jgi:PAS domain S-box-containing protein
MISEELRAGAHLRIGRLLVEHIPPEKREEEIFEIVNQINRGAALITSGDEREQLANLNLIAGKRAKKSAAYAAALNYFAAGGALLSEDRWERSYALAFGLNLAQAECEYLCGNTSSAKQRLEMLSGRAASLIDRAATTCLQIELYTNSDQADRAIAVALDLLGQSGTVWSPHPSDADVSQEFDRVWRQLGDRSIEQLTDLHPLTDPVCSAILDVLTAAHAPANFTDGNLLALIIARIVNLSIAHGNGDGSPLGYVYLGMILESRFGDYNAGFRFGKVGVDLVERAGLDRFKAHAYLNFGNAINPWTRHVRTSLDLLQTALNAANQRGHLTFAAYSYTQLIAAHLFAGDSLDELQRFADSGLAIVQQTGFGTGVDLILGHLGLIRALRGLTCDLSRFDYAEFDETQFEQRVGNDPALAMSACWYWIRRLQACFLAGEQILALSAALKAESLLWTSPGFLVVADYHFYAAMVRAAHYGASSSGDPGDLLEKLKAHQKQIEAWAETCAENFENRHLLLSAEIAQIEGRELDAERLYEQAILSAQANGFVHNEALSNEHAARFYEARGFEKIAHAYLRDARHCYLRWGAAGKVRQLDELYPHLRAQEALSGPAGTIGAPVEHLDLATVFKVSQAVSGEIVLEKLIDTLMRTAIEHAGAGRGLLILPREDVELRVEAEATTSRDTVTVHLQEAPMAEAELPESIVRYVVRTQESLILADASEQNPFSSDSYICRHNARSILCLPLINQGKLIGVLYLENNLTPRVFTPTRIAVLKLLASQAAISLENTRLYTDLQEREAKIRRLVDANIVGIFIWNLQGEIIEANEAFLHMVQYSREDLVSGRVRWTNLTPPEWRERDELAVAKLRATGTVQPREKEYFRKDGGRVPALVGAAMFEGSRSEGVAFVLDLSEQKRAEEALQKAQTELAHITRVAALGELTASIAHEISQPLAAVVTNAKAGLRWLSRNSPDLAEACEAIHRIIRDGNRAGDVISRMRALFKKASTTKEQLDINEVIEEVIVLAQSELQRNRVSLQTRLAADLPPVMGDRIQLEQVMLNLVVNAIEAMSGVAEDLRELRVSSEKFVEVAGKSEEGTSAGRVFADAEGSHVLISVQDSGPGVDPKSLDRLFDAFYTTKPQGMGMGLAISRSIIEAHGGRLWAMANPSGGAVFQFTLRLPTD